MGCRGIALSCSLVLFACSGGDDFGNENDVIDAAAAPGGDEQPDAMGNDAAPNPPDGGTVTGSCGDATFLPLPADTAARGPWPVGARTLAVGRLTVEVWYPAMRGSDAGHPTATYDIREHLPASQQAKISDEDNPVQQCDCVRDLPVDDSHGPYPVVVFVHGTAAFRTQSLGLMTHWASRGFVVIAADHPGLNLGDSLARFCPDTASGSQDLAGDVDTILAALRAGTGAFSFLDGLVDASRLAVTGHSAGGNAAASLSDRMGVRVSIPMAANTAPVSSTSLESTLLMGAVADTVVSYSGTQATYDDAAAPKRLVGIANSGHLAFSDLCELRNNTGKNIVEIAQDSGVCGVFLASFLFDCKDTHLDPGERNSIVRYSTSAVLEDVLMCSGAATNFSALEALHPGVEEYREQL